MMKEFSVKDVDPHQPPNDAELKFMACKVVSAFLRPSEFNWCIIWLPFISFQVMLPWAVTAYAEKVPGSTTVPPGTPNPPEMSATEIEKFKKFFDDATIAHQNSPCIVIDLYGRIVLWYLPEIICQARVVSGVVSGIYLFVYLTLSMQGCT